jgi:hypothetical protein
MGKALPQSYSITGQVCDSLTKEPIPLANVIVTGTEASFIPVGDATDKAGKFAVTGLKPGKYSIKVSFIGYVSYTAAVEIKRSSVELGRIYISQGSVETRQVIVTEKAIPVVVNGDTTEYNSNAFKTNKDADAEELVSKMPGITVQDGTVKAHGEEVKKVTVDGRQFFGSDPRATLKNIPAEMVDRIQVFDEKGEQAEFTGFDDGNTSKTMNIITRTEFRDGTFGKVSAAYGTEESYRATGSINYFNDKQRLSVVTQFNNLNEQNFAMDDLMGIMSGQMGRGGGGRSMGGGMMRGGGGGFQGGASNFLVSGSNGLSSTKAFGVNYSNLFWDKLDLTGSYFFNRTDNDAESVTKRNYFLTGDESQIYNEQSTSSSDNTNHRFNFRIDYDIDSSNSVLFTPNASFQLNKRYSKEIGETSTELSLLNYASGIYNSDLTAWNASAELLYRHRFETSGRTFSVSVNPSANKNYGETNQFSENIYYDVTTAYDTTDQLSEPDVKGIGASTNVVYTEPVTDNSQLQFSMRYAYAEDESDKDVYSLADGSSYSALDTTLSSLYKKISRVQSYGTGYNIRWENLFMTANVDYSITKLTGDQVFPFSFNVDKNFYSILPSLNIRYRKQRDLHWGIFYRTSNNTPEIKQLQPVLDNSNTLYLSIGNPDLKQDYRHTIGVRFMRMNFLTMESFFVNLQGTIINDYRANNTIIASRDTVVNGDIQLQAGSQLTIPVNLNGYYNTQANIMYGLPVSFVPSNMNFSGSIGYTRTPGITNSIINYTNTYTAGLGLMWSSNFSEDLDISLSYNGNYNFAKNNTTSVSNSEYYNQNAKFKFYWTLLESIVLQTELSYQHYGNLSSEYNNNPVLWDFSIGKKLFRNNMGEIRFTAHDVLNQNTNIQQTTTGTYTENTETNSIGRYYLLSFIYTIKMF